jgi:phosphoglycolate phosphatase
MSPLARPLVFDLDGTLIDSRGDISAACNWALKSSGRSPLTIEQICAHVGNGASYLLMKTAGVRLEDEDYPGLARHFRQYYMEHPTDLSALMPGAAEVLRLSGRPKALCTNKPRPVTEQVLKSLGWDQFFQVVVAGGDCPENKPHPAPLHRVAQGLGVAPNQLIMIGDGPQDVGAGRAVGAHTIGVRGGLLDEKFLEESEPDVILASLKELSAYLTQSGI